MKEPDKIYLHRTTGSPRLNGKVHPYKPAKIRDDDKIIEYIRKDALVEWLQQGFDWIKNPVISVQQIIDKLNSM